MEKSNDDMITHLNIIAQEVYQNAVDKGFHPENQSDDAFIEEMCNNLHDEISELHEAWRNSQLYRNCNKPIPLLNLEEELADMVIRVFDNAVNLNVNIGRAIVLKHRYNKTREYRHGNKRS